MNRFHLRLFAPAEEELSVGRGIQEDQFEDIIPIDRGRRSVIFSGRLQDPADRARMISRNSACPECGHHDIEPLELEDAVISPRNRLPVPGTATIVGFHCNDCGIEWPVYELSRRSV
jgi:hypothetical protein